MDDGRAALEARKCVRAISSGVRGTFGFRSLVVTPLIAASMITGSEVMCVTVVQASPAQRRSEILGGLIYEYRLVA